MHILQQYSENIMYLIHSALDLTSYFGERFIIIKIKVTKKSYYENVFIIAITTNNSIHIYDIRTTYINKKTEKKLTTHKIPE